jgi:hypothetical protein
MFKFNASAYSVFTSALATIAAACQSAKKKNSNATLAESNREALPSAFEKIKAHCVSIGLVLSAKTAQRGLELVKLPSSTFAQLGDIVADLNQRIHDELEDNLFLHIPSEKAKLYETKEPLFGEVVGKAFPSAADDIAEAGKCLSLDRGTATVFHLMRAMEVGAKGAGETTGYTLRSQLGIVSPADRRST